MPATDPAERRSVIRGAIECAIGLNPTVRPRQAAPLVASVWRIVEPALAQRDRQINAVLDVLDDMDYSTEARQWAQQLRAALRIHPAATRPPIAWCGASTPDLGVGTPMGPCVLRHGHDGPVHQAASGAKWWPEQTLEVRDLTPPRRISTELADEAAADGAGLYEALMEMFGGLLPPHETAPLCWCGAQPFAGGVIHNPGCAWKNQRVPADPGPLREVAAQALGEEQPAAADAEYDALKAAYLEATTTGAHRVTVLEPDPAAEAHAVVQAVTRQQLHDAIRTLARTDRPWWDGELRRMARLEGRTSFLGGRR